MSLTLKPLDIDNKKELISLAANQLKELPHDYKILDEQVGTKESGYADLIAVDDQNGLVLFYILSLPQASAQIAQSLSNYYWACENILNIKKMYAQAPIDGAVSPKIVYLAKDFSRSTKKALSLLGVSLQALQYQAFDVNGIPCLYLEKIGLKENKESMWELELQKLKKEFSGHDALSEEELAEFLNFEHEKSSE